MPKYMVRIPELHYVEIEVDAPNAEQAKTKAQEILEEGPDSLELTYSHTLDMWDWLVDEIAEAS